MDKAEFLRLGTMIAVKRLTCIKQVKQLVMDLNSPQTKTEHVDKALGKLGAEIMNLSNMLACSASMGNQLRNTGESVAAIDEETA